MKQIDAMILSSLEISVPLIFPFFFWAGRRKSQEVFDSDKKRHSQPIKSGPEVSFRSSAKVNENFPQTFGLFPQASQAWAIWRTHNRISANKTQEIIHSPGRCFVSPRVFSTRALY
jgi:hypothetical protein